MRFTPHQIAQFSDNGKKFRAEIVRVDPNGDVEVEPADEDKKITIHPEPETKPAPTH